MILAALWLWLAASAGALAAYYKAPDHGDEKSAGLDNGRSGNSSPSSVHNGPVTGARAELALSKQRMEPGETITIYAICDKPVAQQASFQLSFSGVDQSKYTTSAHAIVIDSGQFVGIVQLTAKAGAGEERLKISGASNNPDVAVMVDAVSLEAHITDVPRAFYISSTEGNDYYSGTSPRAPLRSLARMSQLGQITGDSILFKAGDYFAGRLVITAGGTSAHPLVIGSYGPGSKPVLDGSIAEDGKGSYRETIYIENEQHIHISDITVTNPRHTARANTSDTESFGIYVLNSGSDVMQNFQFRNLTLKNVFAVEDINTVSFDEIRVTGIMMETLNNNAGTHKYIADVHVEECLFTRIGKLAFWSRRLFAHDEVLERDSIKHRNIVFKNNRVYQNGGSGIVLSNTLNALVEYNSFEYTGSSIIYDKMIGRGSGAWFFQCTNVVAQHNISRHARGDNDSYGMHIDYGNKNVLFQYNYSEDAEGGFVEILGDNDNSIWRYNISVNDGLREKKGNSIWISDYAGSRSIRSSGNYIYNNSIYVGNGHTPDISIKSHDAHIYNNIFQAMPGSAIGDSTSIDTGAGQLEVSNNMYHGHVSAEFTQFDAKAVMADPLFANPGALNAEGYRLLRQSRALGAGENRPHPPFPAAGQGIFSHITEVPATDFFGNPLSDEAGNDVIPIGAFSPKR